MAKKAGVEKDGKVERGAVRMMILPVELKPDEVMARAKQLSGLVGEQRLARERLDAHVEAAKATRHEIEGEIETLASQIAELATAVRNSREDRPVEVYDETDVREGITYTKRADTEEVVASRGLTEAERQRSLFKGAPEKPAAEGASEVPA